MYKRQFQDETEPKTTSEYDNSEERKNIGRKSQLNQITESKSVEILAKKND